MFKMIRWIFILLLSTFSFAKEPLRVIVLDTGINVEDERFTDIFCKDVIGIDFTGQGLLDVDGHGTHVAGIIKQYAGQKDYCLTFIKYYVETQNAIESSKAIISSLKMIKLLHPEFVNFSGGGTDFSEDEFELIKSMPNVKFVVAVGNANQDLNEECNYYPACYILPNIIRVGSLTSNRKKAPTSNYGDIINFWEIGQHVKSTLPNDREGYMSGTSMATAIRTGKLINEKINSCDISNIHCK